MTTKRFPTHSYQLLLFLVKQREFCAFSKLMEQVSLDQSQVMAMCQGFSEKGWLEIEERVGIELRTTEEGDALLERQQPFFERVIAGVLAEQIEAKTTKQLADLMGASAQEIGKHLRYLTEKGYAKREGKALLAEPTAQLEQAFVDEELFARVGAAEGVLLLNEQEQQEPAMQQAIKLLKSRGVVKLKERKQRAARLTEAGRAMVEAGIEEVREENQLTEEMLLSGEWRDVRFRPYDVTLDVAPVYSGKAHPLRRLMERTRRAFLNLGFREIRGPYVESAFWDFDALFQPQDHPAREMQDTFYGERPKQFDLPEPSLVEAIRAVHQDGGDTGSTGWGYRWREDKAKQVVLRTHTTAVTVSSCHQNPAPPQKIFCVGRVFRRETIDDTHLPEFHQVEGVIVDKDASLASLLGTLKAFYQQMGFDK
ncbi:MAG: phenylalanine--tRNA ligase subunit alpha, partial [Myxococcota bacterium]